MYCNRDIGHSGVNVEVHLMQSMQSRFMSAQWQRIHNIESTNIIAVFHVDRGRGFAALSRRWQTDVSCQVTT